MLIYNNSGVTRVILAKSGSVFWRWDNVCIGLCMAMLAFFIQYLLLVQEVDNVFLPKLHHHLGFIGLAGVVNMAIGFRTNLAWRRYWEGLSHLQTMYSKWGDSFMQISAFSTTAIETARSKKTPEGDTKAQRITTALHSIEKYFTLLSALACERVVHGDVGRMEKRCETAPWGKQISLRQDMRHEDLTGAKKLPVFELEKSGTQKHLASAEQMWIGTIYTIRAHPTDRELEVLTSCTERVQIASYWALRCVTMLSKDLDVAPPIQSRMFQELSNGMLGFSNMLKIADVPYPFPHAQLLNIFLIVYVLFLPLFVANFTKSLWLAPALTYMIFNGLWCMNEVAKELENPFGLGPNDIPLVDYHCRFMDMIQDIDMARACQAKDWALQAEASARSMRDYEEGKKEAAAVAAVFAKPDPTPAPAPKPVPVVAAAPAPIPVVAPAADAPVSPTSANKRKSAIEKKALMAGAGTLAGGAGTAVMGKIDENLATMKANDPGLQALLAGKPLELVDQHLTKINACMEFHLELLLKILKEASSMNKGITVMANTPMCSESPTSPGCSASTSDPLSPRTPTPKSQPPPVEFLETSFSPVSTIAVVSREWESM